jgi:hypothetical protein
LTASFPRAFPFSKVFLRKGIGDGSFNLFTNVDFLFRNQEDSVPSLDNGCLEAVTCFLMYFTATLSASSGLEGSP